MISIAPMMSAPPTGSAGEASLSHCKDAAETTSDVRAGFRAIATGIRVESDLYAGLHAAICGPVIDDDRRTVELPVGKIAPYHGALAEFVPEEPVPCRLEHGLGKERALPEVDRAEHVLPHPGFRGGPRVRGGADVDDRYGPSPPAFRYAAAARGHAPLLQSDTLLSRGEPDRLLRRATRLAAGHAPRAMPRKPAGRAPPARLPARRHFCVASAASWIVAR